MEITVSLIFLMKTWMGNAMMSELKKQEIVSRVNAMSREEKELVGSLLPVDICLNRVTTVIERLLTLEKKLKSLS